jgi:hypothetical protein
MLTIQYGDCKFYSSDLYMGLCSFGFTQTIDPNYYSKEAIQSNIKQINKLYCIDTIRIPQCDLDSSIANRFAYINIILVREFLSTHNKFNIHTFYKSLSVLQTLRKNTTVDPSYIDFLEDLLWKENSDICRILKPICKRLYDLIGSKLAEKFYTPDYVWRTKGNQTTVQWLQNRFY